MIFGPGNQGRLVEQKSLPLELRSSSTFPRAGVLLHGGQCPGLYCHGVLLIGVRAVADETMAVGFS